MIQVGNEKVKLRCSKILTRPLLTIDTCRPIDYFRPSSFFTSKRGD